VRPNHARSDFHHDERISLKAKLPRSSMSLVSLRPMTLGMSTLIRVTFWVALIFTVVCATVPADVAPNALRSDSAEHFLAFYVLALLAAAAYPRTDLAWVGTSLSAFGALIEIAQAIPIVHRDASFKDWFVDTAAITAALAPAILIAWRMGIKQPD
jgi:hypothetical protein